MTEGGPNESTMTPPLVIYERAFLYGDLGYAAMLSLVLLVSTAVVVGLAALVSAAVAARVTSPDLSSP